MRRSLALASLVLSMTARGAIYENVRGVEDEDDVYSMEERGDIDADTADTLREMLDEGVDLNGANRDRLYDLPGLTYADVDAILEYRKAKGRIDDPAELVGAGAITAEQLVEIAPYIRLDPANPRLPVSGRVRAVSQVTNADNVAPPVLLGARLKAPWDLSGGFELTTTRRSTATPRYDPLVDTLVTPGYGYFLNVPRGYLQWRSGRGRIVAGTFLIGFGEKLTLDVTRRHTPRGIVLTQDFRRARDLTRTCTLSGSGLITDIPCAGNQPDLYVTSDFAWRDALRGVAGSLEDIDLGKGATGSAYAWLSYQTKSVYQYQLFDHRTCDDPHDTSSGCDAPDIYVNEGVNTGNTRLIFSTLHYLYDELMGGAHIDVKPSYRYRLGLTGWGAMPFFHADPMKLDFQEWSSHPNGGSFGAVGIDGQAAFGDWDFFFEGSRTFDHSVGGGGGWGAIVRTEYSPKGHDVDLSLRFYDNKISNPYNRPPSAPDLVDGEAANNELGVRLRYLGRFGKDWELRTTANFWVLPYAGAHGEAPGTPSIFWRGRVDFTGWTFMQPGLWLDVHNRDLTHSDHGACKPTASSTSDALIVSCDSYRATARVEFFPLYKKLTVTLHGSFALKDDINSRYKTKFRQDLNLWAEVRGRPFDWLQLRLRSMYYDEGLDDPTTYETSWRTFAEGTWVASAGTRISLRYDAVVWLDQRASTASRVPNPEHRFMLDARVQF